MSQFRVPVVQIGKVGKHPNADTLSITQVEGCPVIFKTGDFQPGDLAIYVPIESLVKQGTPGLEFLQYNINGQARIKAVRLRGIFSMGLLIPFTQREDLELLEENVSGGAPVDWVGYDCAADLGITKYEEAESGPFMSTENEPDPGLLPVYDMESYRRLNHIFEPGELVAITEKVHGANGRFVHDGTRLWVGSHNCWKRPDERNMWWRAAADLKLQEKLAKIPGIGLYGEVYGRVQDLHYGLDTGQQLVFFDAMDTKTRKFLDFPDFLATLQALDLPWVPVLWTGHHDEAKVHELAEGKSELGGKHIREGVVVRPLLERYDLHNGRVCLKLHGQGYLLRKGGREGH